MSRFFVVTHGEKEEGVPNPGMTPDGFEQVAALRHLLPSQPPCVAVGTGRRQLDVAKALGLEPTYWSIVWGGAETLLEGSDGKLIVLADGTKIPYNRYKSGKDMAASAISAGEELPFGSVVCSGRPAMIRLGKKDAKSASVYQVQIVGGQVSIEEVVETGGVEKHAV